MSTCLRCGRETIRNDAHTCAPQGASDEQNDGFAVDPARLVVCRCGHTRGAHYYGKWTDCLADGCSCLTFTSAEDAP